MEQPTVTPQATDTPATDTSAAPVTGAPQTPETKAPQEANPSGRSDADIVSELEKKFSSNPDFAPSDEETKAYERWMAKKDKAPAKDPESQPEEDGQETETQASPIPKGFEEIIGEKSPIGAKSIEEVPAKIKGLLEKVQEFDRKAGTWGREKQMLTKGIQETKAGFDALIRDLYEGNPRALAHIEQNADQFGIRPKQRGQQQPAEDPTDKFLDPDLAKHVQSKIDEMERVYRAKIESLESKFGRIDQARDAHLVNEQIAAEMTQLTEKYPELRPQNGSIRELFLEYRKGAEGDPIDPRIAPLIQLLEIAEQKRLDNLEDAYALHAFKNRSQQIIEAKQQARKELTGRPASVGMSDVQGTKTSNYQQFTDADFQAMADGRVPIPQGWFVNGSPTSLMPARLRAQFTEHGVR